MKTVLAVLLGVHALIHFMGFAKAFGLAQLEQLSIPIGRPTGMLWLAAGVLFLLSGVFFVLRKDSWPIWILLGVGISQTLVFLSWSDARFGTVTNGILLLVALVALGVQGFENSYLRDVELAMKANPVGEGLVTEADLEPLPAPVREYLRYVGVVGKPKVYNVRIVFEGRMRDRGKDWFSFTSEQYNFLSEPTRLFFMKARIMGLPVHGYHAYKEGSARMLIKLLSLIPVADHKEAVLFPTETVTYFNDLCLFAPAALIDPRIRWETLDEYRVKANFTNGKASISAILHFNEAGQLVNFVSEDRYSVDKMQAFPFSTPVSDYMDVNGYQLPGFGQAIWQYPEGAFTYGEFRLKEVDYNVTTPK